jgi:hypothetical protein
MIFKGQVAEPGFGHFCWRRPKFYEAVFDLTGVRLRPGTINVKLDGEMPSFPLFNTKRIPGEDEIDIEDKQDILITPCVMAGRTGFWILPVFKETLEPNPKGHFPKNTIEISLVEEMSNIAPGFVVSLEIPGMHSR